MYNIDKIVVLATLAEAVRAMRQAQREYFKTRNYEALTRAKRADTLANRLSKSAILYPA